MKVLVVDDDSSVRESLGKVLNGEGYDVVLAADGQHALEWLQHGSIDLLLLDLGLPIRNGWEVYERLTALHPLMPVIVTVQSNHYHVAAAAGVGAILEKPLDAPRLLQMIRELLAEPAHTQPQQARAQGGNSQSLPCDAAAFLMKLREQHTLRFRGAPIDGREPWRRA